MARLVVDDEDAGHGRPRRQVEDDGEAAAGRVVEQEVAADDAHKPRATASPSPTPAWLLRSPRRWNGWKTRSRSSAHPRTAVDDPQVHPLAHLTRFDCAPWPSPATTARALATMLATARSRSAGTLVQALQRRQPDLKDIAQTVAQTTVHRADQLSRSGSLREAESTLRDGVRQYAALHGHTDTLQLTRNAAHAQMLLGRVSLMRGHVPDAAANFATAADGGTLRQQFDPGNRRSTWDVVAVVRARPDADRGRTRRSGSGRLSAGPRPVRARHGG